MTTVDIAVFILIALIYPAYAIMSGRGLRGRLEKGGGRARLRWYRYSAAEIAGVGLLALLGWRSSGRPLGGIGLQAEPSLLFWVAMALVLLLAGGLWYQLARTRSDAVFRRKVTDEIAPLKWLTPQSYPEYRSFAWLSLTAGIGEEIIFRGVLMSYLALFMPQYFAAALALVPFAVGHSYQGASGVIKAGAAGAAMTGLYLISGSLVPAMLAHTLIDLGSGRLALETSGSAAAKEAGESG